MVPEWGGMVPSQVKNIFLLASNNEFAHKPGLIVTLSESLGALIRSRIKIIFL